MKNGGDFDETKVLVQANFSYPATPNDVDTREVEIPTIASGATTTIEIPGRPPTRSSSVTRARS